MIYIEYRDEKHPFKFSQYSLIEFGKISGLKTMGEINKSLSSFSEMADDFENIPLEALEQMSNLFYACFVVGAKINKVECKISDAEVLDLLVEVPGFIEQAMKAISISDQNRIPAPEGN